MGRTAWDHRMTMLFTPAAHYYHCDELLREAFYAPAERVIPEELTLVTTISTPPYKGIDVVLKTAKVLTEIVGIPFTWHVFGISECTMAERRYHLRHDKVNVILRGVASAETLRETLLHATAYVHTSYIDNSPNSVCEAQMLGITTVATNIGGIPSLITDGVTGLLTPANDPYQMAYLINDLYHHRERNEAMGRQSRALALQRHDPSTITTTILRIYNDIISHEQSL